MVSGLLDACAQGNVDFLREYVSEYRHRSYYDSKDNHRWGPLHHAVASGSYECIHLLLSTRYIKTRSRSHEGHTCLYVGIERRVSRRIIRMLLKYDPGLIDIPNNEQVYPMHVAIISNSLDLVRTMVETLREENIQIGEQLDLDGDNSLFLAVRGRNEPIIDFLINNTTPKYTHRNDSDINAVSVAMVPVRGADENAVFRIVTKLLPLTYDSTSARYMRSIMLPMMFSAFHPNEDTFNWFVNEYYLCDGNELRDVFIRAMTTFERNNDTKKLFLGLHSKLHKFHITERDSVQNNILYNNLFKTLMKLYCDNETVCREVADALRPKIDKKQFNRTVRNLVPTHTSRELCYTSYVEMFFQLGLGSFFDIERIFDSCTARNHAYRLFKLFMPFSSALTGDIVDNMLPVYAHPEDQNLAQFCVNGRFLAYNGLMGLCRVVIRKCILKGNESFEVKMNCFRQLGLPRSLLNFLLFNYTSYEFT